MNINILNCCFCVQLGALVTPEFMKFETVCMHFTTPHVGALKPGSR